MEQARAEERRCLEAEVAAFVAAHPTDAMPSRLDDRFAWLVDYQRALHAAGLAVPSWPAELGGRGLSAGDALVVLEALGRSGSPELVNFVAVEVVAPALRAFVDDERLARWLPAMASADEVWCQLFSEPDAGSDLAALRTRAVPTDGGGWLVSGTKVWSTWAQFAQRGLLLARTGSMESRHRGITAFVVDLAQPGVEVHPLVSMTGDAEFAEVVFDGLRVGEADVVGEVGGGWAVAMHMLANERGPYALRRAAVLRSALGRMDPGAAGAVGPHVRRALLDAHVALWLLDRRAAGVAAAVEAGLPVGPDSPLTKVVLTEAEQAIYTAGQLARGMAGVAGLDGGWADEWLYSRAASIYGGSAQIQRNVIGERLLQLPAEPRPA